MATSDKRPPARGRNPLGGLNLAQLLKLRALARTHPDLHYATTRAGVIVLYLPGWLADGWLRMGDRQETEHAGPIAHLIPADGILRGYCERKPDAAEAPYCGTRSDPKPRATRRLTFRPYDADALTAQLTAARAKARRRAA